MPRRKQFEIGRCACGASVAVDSFRDGESYDDFYRRGLCQDCHDARLTTGPASTRRAMRRGAVVAHAFADRSSPSVAAIPFLFCEPGRFIAWESRHALRIGPNQQPADPLDDLFPMRHLLGGHQIRVHDEAALDEPSVVRCLGPLDLMIGLEPESWGRLESDSIILRRVPFVDLASAFPWSDSFGIPLGPLGHFAAHVGLEPWLPDPRASNRPLRTCALLGAALSLETPFADARRTSVLECVLAMNRVSSRGSF